MTPENKLTALSILSRLWWKTKEQAELEIKVIEAITHDLIPKENLPLVVTEVYRDAPYVITQYDTWPDAMGRIEKIRGNEKIHAVHVTRGEDIEYTWSAQD